MMKTIIFAFVLFPSLFACAPAVQGPEVLDSGVRFTYHDRAARSVSLAGDFNHWDPGKTPLLGPGSKGRWSTTLPLAAGRYEYRFVVNGTEWVLDPLAPAVDDGMGGRNSVVLVAH